MKRFNSRLVAALTFTFIYLSLLALNIVHLPKQLGLPTQHGSNYSRISKGTPETYSSFVTDDGLGSQDSFPYSAWLQLSRRLMLIGSRSSLHLDLKATSSGSGPKSQKILIGGSWRNSLIHLGAAKLNLSSAVTFIPPSPMMDEILPSSMNGYLNSRIDLRRRRRAFAIISDTIPPPSIVLQLREDAALEPRNVDPSVLRGEFENAVARNNRLKEAFAARKLRKGRKKKKDTKVNSAE
ncbi:hypothetical protein FRC11_006961 [Ceratobasidium sp. 423]|nr:hypothetical protein FRC11_006961 [Ceratobasidium sp. 423]